MKFEIMPQKLAEQTDGRDRCLISIYDTMSAKPRFSYPWKDILYLEFDDLCPDECRSRGYEYLLEHAELFDEDQARQIFNFITNHSDKDFVVHCHAGISRSSAIAIFLAEKFGELVNTKEYMSKTNPNPYVTKIMNNVYKEIMENAE